MDVEAARAVEAAIMHGEAPVRRGGESVMEKALGEAVGEAGPAARIEGGAVAAAAARAAHPRGRGSRVVTVAQVAGAGHQLFVEQPDAFADLVLERCVPRGANK